MELDSVMQILPAMCAKSSNEESQKFSNLRVQVSDVSCMWTQDSNLNRSETLDLKSI